MKSVSIFCTLIFALFLIAPSLSPAQSITFDYTQATLSGCNVFAGTTASNGQHTPVSIQGYSHITSFGYPKYDNGNTEKAVTLAAVPQTSQARVGATQYAISYNFKKNYFYTVRAYMKGVRGLMSNGNPAGYFPRLSLNFDTDNGGTNKSTTCNNTYVTVDAGFDNQYGQGVSGASYAWSQYLINKTANDNYTYLLVAAVPADASNTTDAGILSTINIQKIEITETAPTGFTLTPPSTSLACGSTGNQTFTVNNLYGTSVTNYTYNLGSTPNGWTYMNADAPASITLSSNSITLTPKCGIQPKNISVVVHSGNNNYNTNSAVINLVTYPPAIYGPGVICNSEDFILYNLPCDATFSWFPLSGNVTSTTGPDPYSLTVTRTGGGYATISATVTSGCFTNGSTTVSKNVTVGPLYLGFNIETYPQSEPSCFSVEGIYSLRCVQSTGQPFNGDFQWGYRIQGTSGETIMSNSYMYSTFIPPQAGTYEVFVRPLSDCGAGPESIRYVTVTSDCMGGELGRMAISENSISVYPNPAKDVINLKISEYKPSVVKGKANPTVQFALYDNITSTLVKTWKVAAKQSTYTLDLKGVRKGRYFIKYTNGNIQLIKQVIVE